jgi:hypothetical protein
MYPAYPPLPLKFVFGLIWSIIFNQKRSFRKDAISCTKSWNVRIKGKEYTTTSAPVMYLMNHYCRPGFQVWMLAMGISATIPADVNWIMTGAWTDDGTIGGKIRAWISPRIFPRLGNVYGFINMPPMPPRKHEVLVRASAVKKIIHIARQNPHTILAISPEGQDSWDGKLMRPHPGVGRLLTLLQQLGYSFIPVGLFEDGNYLSITFGHPFNLVYAPGLSPQERDCKVAEIVMFAIANLLPIELQGEYDYNKKNLEKWKN